MVRREYAPSQAFDVECYRGRWLAEIERFLEEAP
jgi:hypothetical protein